MTDWRDVEVSKGSITKGRILDSSIFLSWAEDI